MKNLFKHWDNLKGELGDKHILLLLDYDGTLTAIRQTPKEAVIPKDTKELLEKFSGNSHCALAIISGRSLKDIKSIVGIKDIIYAGNHGLEVEGPKIKFESHVSPRLKSVIRNVAKELSERLSGIKGILIEDKGLTISVHYRLVDERCISMLENILKEVTKSAIVRGEIRINSGKKVYEIKPPVMWDKGKVVSWLLARQQFALGENKVFPIYIGDDVTDEDAFKVIKDNGLGVFVGEPTASQANYYLKDTDEVVKFLKQILILKKS
ncbi:MAG: trehalose-phosphatase [Candidatus Omnitrophota bacterium]